MMRRGFLSGLFGAAAAGGVVKATGTSPAVAAPVVPPQVGPILSYDGFDLKVIRYGLAMDSVLSPEYDIISRYTLSVCVIRSVGPGIPVVEGFRSLLMVPRRPFRFVDPGRIDIDLPTPDVMGGPLPSSCHATRIGESNVYYFKYTIQFHVKESDS